MRDSIMIKRTQTPERLRPTYCRSLQFANGGRMDLGTGGVVST